MESKEILISVKPQWVKEIVNNKKTIEIRKTMPKCELPCKVYIYCTKGKNRFNICAIHNKSKDKKDYSFCEIGNGKVVAEFTLNKIESFTTDYRRDKIQTKRILASACVDFNTAETYEFDSPCLYAWYIDNLKIYDKPIGLNQFEILKTYAPKTKNIVFRKAITKPPQSWCYIVKNGGNK